jgi:hypothetical protein
MQSDHQPNGIAGPAHVLIVTIGKLSIKPRPVYNVSQPAEFVLQVKNLL